MMNVWLAAALVLMIALVPCAFVALRAPAVDRLVALEMAAVVVTLFLICCAEAFRRPSFFDLPLATALLSLGGSLVFVRFFERWL